MIFAFNDVGKYGIIKDVAPHELPPGAWSDGKNMRFTSNHAEKVKGTSILGTGVLSVSPYHLAQPILSSGMDYVYFGANKIYSVLGTTHTNRTRQSAGVDVDYNNAATPQYSNCLLDKILIMNNQVDDPQFLDASTTVAADNFANLTNWPTNYRCRAIRSYKQFLIAVGMAASSGTVLKSRTVRWSHPADPGTVPASWDITDTTKDAGEYNFSETGGVVVDCVPLRDVNIVYKTDSVWAMQYVGGVDIFSFKKLFSTFGIANLGCAVEYTAGKHFVFTGNDFIIHDGVTSKSLLENIGSAWLSTYIPDANAKVVINPLAHEIWVSTNVGATGGINSAIIWDWETNTFTVRTLPQVSHLISQTFGLKTDSATYALNTSPLAIDLTNKTILLTEDTEQISGVNMTAQLIRSGIGVPFKQNMPPDFTSMKFCRNIWPRIEGTDGGTVNVYIGTQMDIDGAVTWSAAKPYIIGTTRKIDTLATGRLLAVKFESDSNLTWKLHGYEMDISFRGVR